MVDDAPLTALESALADARAGRSPIAGFLGLFANSVIAVPSAGEIKPDFSGFQPILFDKEGVQMVACFTTVTRIGAIADHAPYCLTIKGGEFLRRVPAGYGLVVNPGHMLGFDVGPDGLRKIAADFA